MGMKGGAKERSLWARLAAAIPGCNAGHRRTKGTTKPAPSGARADGDHHEHQRGQHRSHPQEEQHLAGKSKVLVDDASLRMSQESIAALRAILEREFANAVKANASLKAVSLDRDVAMESRVAALDEEQALIAAVDDLSRDHDKLGSEIQALRVKLDTAKGRERSLGAQLGAWEEKISHVASLEVRNTALDDELVRARSVLKAERSRRTKLQAQIQAEIDEATSSDKQESDELSAEASQLQSLMVDEREKQQRLRDSLHRFHSVLSKANADVMQVRTARREKLDRIHQQVLQQEDSPAKAEYRRAQKRLHTLRGEVDAIKVDYARRLEMQKLQEQKICDVEEERKRWKTLEEEREASGKSVQSADGPGDSNQGAPSTAAAGRGKKRVVRKLFP